MITAQESLGISLPAAKDAISTSVSVFAPALAHCGGFLGTLPKARCVKASTKLIEQGERVKKVQLLENGLVKLTNVNVEGHETLIGLRSDGWYAGSTSLLLDAPSVYSVYACTDCSIIEITVEEFFSCLNKSPAMMNHFILGLCREVVSYSALQVELVASKAEDRLNLLLRERAESSLTGKILDPLPLLKQMELAQLISVTPEHLCRLRQRKRLRPPSPNGSCAPRRPVLADRRVA
jgi:CRP/FNR family transcriptional regulator